MIAAHMDEIGVMATHITKEGLRALHQHRRRARPIPWRAAACALPTGRSGSFTANRWTAARGAAPGQTLHRRRRRRSGRLPGQRRRRGRFRALLHGARRPTGGQEHGRPHRLRGGHRDAQAARGARPTTFTSSFQCRRRSACAARRRRPTRSLPDVGIALDVTLTGDTPEARPMAVALGEGAAIKAQGQRHDCPRRARAADAPAGGRGDIPYQMEVLDGGTTDARAMQIAGPGCAAGCISIPCRYVHSQSETVSAADVESCVALLTAILAQSINLPAARWNCLNAKRSAGIRAGRFASTPARP